MSDLSGREVPSHRDPEGHNCPLTAIPRSTNALSPREGPAAVQEGGKDREGGEVGGGEGAGVGIEDGEVGGVAGLRGDRTGRGGAA